MLGALAFAVALKYAPPPLVNPTVVNIPQGQFQKWCRPGEDVQLVWPKERHVGTVTVGGCHNMVSIGGLNSIAKTADLSNTAMSRGLYIKDLTGVAHIDGFRTDGSGGAMMDGIVISAPLATVQIQNTRIEGVYGHLDQFHGDCIQPYGGVKVLRVYNVTCPTGYQGLSIWSVPASPRGWTVDLERVNVSSIGPAIYGPHNTGGVLFWPCADTACVNPPRVTLKDVYLQPRPTSKLVNTVYAPRAALTTTYVHPTINFPGLPIDGHVTQGPPPGGDFAP